MAAKKKRSTRTIHSTKRRKSAHTRKTKAKKGFRGFWDRWCSI